MDNPNAKEYNVIVKVLCCSCADRKRNRQRIQKDCSCCTFVKYHNVTKFRSFLNWIDKNKPDWVYFKVYDKKTKSEIRTFTNWYRKYNQRTDGSYEFLGLVRDVPLSENF